MFIYMLFRRNAKDLKMNVYEIIISLVNVKYREKLYQYLNLKCSYEQSI